MNRHSTYQDAVPVEEIVRVCERICIRHFSQRILHCPSEGAVVTPELTVLAFYVFPHNRHGKVDSFGGYRSQRPSIEIHRAPELGDQHDYHRGLHDAHWRICPTSPVTVTQFVSKRMYSFVTARTDTPVIMFAPAMLPIASAIA